MAQTVEDWGRQDDESDKAWAAFTLYRDMAERPRKLLVAYNAYQRTRLDDWCDTDVAPSWFKKWSSRHKWLKRAAAYDSHLDSIKLEAVEADLRSEYEALDNQFKWLSAQALAALSLKAKHGLLGDESFRELRLTLESATKMRLELYTTLSMSSQGSSEEGIQRWLEATLPSDDAIKKIFSE